MSASATKVRAEAGRCGAEVAAERGGKVARALVPAGGRDVRDRAVRALQHLRCAAHPYVDDVAVRRRARGLAEHAQEVERAQVRHSGEVVDRKVAAEVIRM